MIFGGLPDGRLEAWLGLVGDNLSMTPSGDRALVLGSGGATGIAWQAAVLAGLADSGVELTPATVIGTSAGALVAARLTTGWTPERLFAVASAESLAPGRVGLGAVLALGAAQVYPSRRHALAWLGRRAERAWSADAETRWVARLVPDLAGAEWPDGLVIVATDAASGRPAFFSHSQPADLARAVAASCAIPGVFPAVRIDGRLHLDGGLRSPANLDVVASATSVIALAPLGGSVRAYRRPAMQAKALGRRAAVALLRPDERSRKAMGSDLLASHRNSAAAAAGREQGRREGERLGGWPA